MSRSLLMAWHWHKWNGQGGRPTPPVRPLKHQLFLANLPNHARSGNLDERAVARRYELRCWVRLSEVPHCAIIHQVRAAIRSEPQVRWPIDPANSIISEGLIESRVVREPLLAKLQWA